MEDQEYPQARHVPQLQLEKILQKALPRKPA